MGKKNKRHQRTTDCCVPDSTSGRHRKDRQRDTTRCILTHSRVAKLPDTAVAKCVHLASGCRIAPHNGKTTITQQVADNAHVTSTECESQHAMAATSATGKAVGATSACDCAPLPRCSVRPMPLAMPHTKQTPPSDT